MYARGNDVDSAAAVARDLIAGPGASATYAMLCARPRPVRHAVPVGMPWVPPVRRTRGIRFTLVVVDVPRLHVGG